MFLLVHCSQSICTCYFLLLDSPFLLYKSHFSHATSPSLKQFKFSSLCSTAFPLPIRFPLNGSNFTPFFFLPLFLSPLDCSHSKSSASPITTISRTFPVTIVVQFILSIPSRFPISTIYAHFSHIVSSSLKWFSNFSTHLLLPLFLYP